MDGTMTDRLARTVISNGIFQQVPWEQLPVSRSDIPAVKRLTPLGSRLPVNNVNNICRNQTEANYTNIANGRMSMTASNIRQPRDANHTPYERRMPAQGFMSAKRGPTRSPKENYIAIIENGQRYQTNKKSHFRHTSDLNVTSTIETKSPTELDQNCQYIKLVQNKEQTNVNQMRKDFFNKKNLKKPGKTRFNSAESPFEAEPLENNHNSQQRKFNECQEQDLEGNLHQLLNQNKEFCMYSTEDHRHSSEVKIKTKRSST